jgi:hypothetical protein
MLAFAIVAVLARVAGADTAKPWLQGVSEATQNQANALFSEANQLFAQQAHAPAVEKYRAALALWDHPLIRFNLAVTLIRLDRTLEAADELERALRFGSDPFPADLYQQALDYQALLKKQVGNVAASCDQAGVHVLLDGKPWFECPGAKTERVLAGPHAVVGERDGYLTASTKLVVVGGGTDTAKLHLVTLDAAVKLEYPYPRWAPWAVTGAGAAIALGGLAVWLSGRAQMDQFSTDLAAACPSGCTLSSQMSSLANERDSAELKGKIAVAMGITGGVAIVGGVVFTILNHPKRVMPVEIAPTQGGITAAKSWTF